MRNVGCWVSHKWKPKTERKKQDNQDSKWRGMEFTSKETHNIWLKQSMIGRVRKPEKIFQVQEAMIVEGPRCVGSRYMGDNMFLLSGDGETHINEFVEKNKEWLRNFFQNYSVVE